MAALVMLWPKADSLLTAPLPAIHQSPTNGKNGADTRLAGFGGQEAIEDIARYLSKRS
jgi:hypothetical protein